MQHKGKNCLLSLEIALIHSTEVALIHSTEIALRAHTLETLRRTKREKEKGTDVDSWAGASTSLNLLTSGIASVCIAATRPEQSRNTRRLSEARNRAEQSLRKQEAAGDRVTYDDEDLGDRASFGSHGRRCET